MERMLEKKFQVGRNDAKKVLAKARNNLGLQKTCLWSDVLEKECLRLCDAHGWIENGKQVAKRRAEFRLLRPATSPSSNSSSSSSASLSSASASSSFDSSASASSSSTATVTSSMKTDQAESGREQRQEKQRQEQEEQEHEQQSQQERTLSSPPPLSRANADRRNKHRLDSNNSFPNEHCYEPDDASLSLSMAMNEKKPAPELMRGSDVNDSSSSSIIIRNNQRRRKHPAAAGSSQGIIDPMTEYMSELLVSSIGWSSSAGTLALSGGGGRNDHEDVDEAELEDTCEIISDNAGALRLLSDMNRSITSLSTTTRSISSTTESHLSSDNSSSRFEVGTSCSAPIPPRQTDSY